MRDSRAPGSVQSPMRPGLRAGSLEAWLSRHRMRLPSHRRAPRPLGGRGRAPARRRRPKRACEPPAIIAPRRDRGAADPPPGAAPVGGSGARVADERIDARDRDRRRDPAERRVRGAAGAAGGARRRGAARIHAGALDRHPRRPPPAGRRPDARPRRPACDRRGRPDLGRRAPRGRGRRGGSLGPDGRVHAGRAHGRAHSARRLAARGPQPGVQRNVLHRRRGPGGRARDRDVDPARAHRGADAGRRARGEPARAAGEARRLADHAGGRRGCGGIRADRHGRRA